MLVFGCFMLLLICLVLWIISFWRPGFFFGVVITQFASEQVMQSGIEIFSRQQALFNIAVGIAVLTTLAVRLLQGKVIIGFGRVNGFIFAIIGWALMTLIWTPSQDEAIEIVLTLVPYLSLISFLAPHMINSHRDLGDGLLSIVFVMAPTLSLSMATEWGMRAVLIDEDLTGNPLALGSGAVSMSIICLVLLIHNISDRLLVHISLLVFAAFGYYICYQTGSRGQFWFGITCSLFVIGKSLPRIWAQLLFAIISTLVAIIVFDVDLESFIAGRWSLDALGRSFQEERIARYILPVWTEWVRQGVVTQLLGLGLCASIFYTGSYPHVILLESLMELGIVGFTIIVTGIVILTREYLFEFAKIPQKYMGKLAWQHIAICTLVGFFGLISFKQGSFLNSFDLYGIALTLARVNLFIRHDFAK